LPHVHPSSLGILLGAFDDRRRTKDERIVSELTARSSFVFGPSSCTL
jgi:hypothetical protein